MCSVQKYVVDMTKYNQTKLYGYRFPRESWFLYSDIVFESRAQDSLHNLLKMFQCYLFALDPRQRKYGSLFLAKVTDIITFWELYILNHSISNLTSRSWCSRRLYTPHCCT